MLQLTNVSKNYLVGDNLIKALEKISITVKQGEFLAVTGPSGSGKSTFLQVASMLAQPTSGKIQLRDKDVTLYNEVERAKLRNKHIGFIFQQFNLLPRTIAIDNVALPLVYAHIKAKEQKRLAIKMLIKVGLEDRLYNTSAQLSGGQQQRVAIARALINNPDIIFADEPTGNLDSKSGSEVMKILTKLHSEGKTIVMVTHEEEIARIAQRRVIFKDGKIVKDTKQKKKRRKRKC